MSPLVLFALGWRCFVQYKTENAKAFPRVMIILHPMAMTLGGHRSRPLT
jgi:hypothetical protein